MDFILFVLIVLVYFIPLKNLERNEATRTNSSSKNVFVKRVWKRVPISIMLTQPVLKINGLLLILFFIADILSNLLKYNSIHPFTIQILTMLGVSALIY